MKRFLRVAIPTLLTVGMVWAASPSATVSWTAPSAYTDNTPLPAASIDHYTVSWSGAGAPGSLTTKSLSAVVPVTCGSVNISVTVTTSTSAVYPNTTSAPAGPVAFASGVSCTPNPPGALAVRP